MDCTCCQGARSSVAHDAVCKNCTMRRMNGEHFDVQWFKARKAKLHLNDGDIGARLHLERSAVNKMMNGKYQDGPSLPQVIQLAVIFQTTRLEILRRVGFFKAGPATNQPIYEALEVLLGMRVRTIERAIQVLRLLSDEDPPMGII